MKIPMRLTAVWLFVFLSCARSEPLPEISKTYQVPTGTITVSVDSVAVNPVERLTVSVETHREDGKLPVLAWSEEPPLTILDTFETPGKTVYRFDSAVPGEYVLPRLKVAFPEEREFFIDEIPITVCAVVFVLLFAILIALLVRYRILKKRLKEAIDLQPLNILTALNEAVANRFDTLKIDQAAVLILRAVMLSMKDEAQIDEMMRRFPVETIQKLRERTEKYQKIAFTKASVGKLELTEDLNFFISFQKEWNRLKNEEAAKK